MSHPTIHQPSVEFTPRTDHAVLRFEGQIGHELAARFLTELNTAIDYYQFKRIDVELDSPGGRIDALLRMVRRLREVQDAGVDIRMEAHSQCMSAAAWLVSMGNWGHRTLGVDAHLVFHLARSAIEPTQMMTAQDCHRLASQLSQADDGLLKNLAGRMAQQAGSSQAFAQALSWRLGHLITHWDDSTDLMDLQCSVGYRAPDTKMLRSLQKQISGSIDDLAVQEAYQKHLKDWCSLDRSMDVRTAWGLCLVDRVPGVLTPQGLAAAPGLRQSETDAMRDGPSNAARA